MKGGEGPNFRACHSCLRVLFVLFDICLILWCTNLRKKAKSTSHYNYPMWCIRRGVVCALSGWWIRASVFFTCYLFLCVNATQTDLFLWFFPTCKVGFKHRRFCTLNNPVNLKKTLYIIQSPFETLPISKYVATPYPLKERSEGKLWFKSNQRWKKSWSNAMEHVLFFKL